MMIHLTFYPCLCLILSNNYIKFYAFLSQISQVTSTAQSMSSRIIVKFVLHFGLKIDLDLYICLKIALSGISVYIIAMAVTTKQ